MENRSRVFLLAFLICLARCAESHDTRQVVYGKVVNLLAPGEDDLSESAVRSFFKLLEKRVQWVGVSCEKSVLEENIHQLVSNYTSSSGLQEDGFFRLAAGCCLFLSSASNTCTAIREDRWAQETDHFIQSVLTHDDHTGNHDEGFSLGTEGLHKLLHDMEESYLPESHDDHCLSLTDILHESNVTDHGHQQADPHTDLDTVLGTIIYHVLLGDCMSAHSLPEKEFFMDYIFSHFGQDNITVRDLESLMNALNLGHLGGSNNHVPDHDHDHDHDHRQEAHGGREGPRHSHEEPQVSFSSWNETCFSAQELLRIYHLNSSGLSRDQFTQLSPALIQQLLSKACTETSPTTDPTGDPLSITERYLYATLANTVICLMALFGIVVLLCTSCSSLFQLCIQFCISLAVGSLTGDALLHLLPTFLGLHVHGEGPSDGHDHSEENSTHIFKLLVVLGGIYYFYLLETIFSIITRKNTDHHHHHGEEGDPHHCDHGKVLQMYQREKKKKLSTSQADLVDGENNNKSIPEPAPRTREQKLLPYMITISDGIHNFADGLAMGAAFSLSWRSGLATSLAVLCHELPHELGDFAVLLHCGVSVKKALLLNVGSALTSFIGLYIALSISTDTTAKEWIAAVTTGLFLYVGLADMLPSMIHAEHKRPWLMFALQNLGLWTGWGILLLLSFFEDRIGV
ncbi:zinc transporter ZIP4 [Salminus brasiliensis]|uniref:zinc transporter ZIP4 n=1 Tax=Salminus brasiliensis TaxID=930266 RepID=UPI003B82D94C